ncbi:MAG: aldehyde dehydrogenase family protein, partial [Actinomycetota bacterium]|nr:aldehyde dehydrogenase family protein [Actinomycetota bacterium]
PEADDAVAVAVRAAEGWRRTPAVERAAVLFRAAEWMRARREELAALEVFEAGKPWAEADADVCEAVDFCEYYGREMLRLDRGGVVESPPGEANSLRYVGKGVAVVIAPWNFPLAIPTGMVSAALVAGNAVVFKPAEQTPAVAYRLVQALEAAGLPPGVLGFVPGIGEEVGARLVEHPDVALVAFTGSLDVGLRINQEAAARRPGQRHVKRVIAELGGKNALVVDADADLDQAVPAIASSAFGYAGQKCSAASRLVVVDAVYDELVRRLVGHAAELPLGHPRSMGVKVGPLIDAEAWKRVRACVEGAPREGTVLLARDDVPAQGYFVGPAIVGDVARSSSLATDEVFGPVLTVFRAADFDEALAIANDTHFALTGGVFSRSPAHVRMATEELRAGNVYVNRAMTGAVVGRQPFGGYGMSGVGSKAGGPDYLLQFLDPRVVTENTMRQGFVPTS